MGRLSRHRKIKSCDPFYKGPKVKDNSCNAPVQQCEIDSQPMSRKANALFKVRRKINKKDKNVSDSKKVKEKFVRKAGEGKREYFQRLDKQAAEEVSEIMAKGKHVSQKRKQYLKARKEKRSKKGFEEDAHMEFTKDHFTFGEVVNEPPKLTVKPRRAELIIQDGKERKVNSLLLKSKFGKETEEKEKAVTETLNKFKKRKHMSGIEQQKSDKIRLEAIDAYRTLKKQNASEAKDISQNT